MANGYSASIVVQEVPKPENAALSDLGIHVLIKKGTDPFFSADVQYWWLDQASVQAITGALSKEILNRLPGWTKTGPSNGNTAYQWANLDVRGVFKMEDGLSEALNSLIDWGRKQWRARGLKVD
jgi:hypothetical protein